MKYALILYFLVPFTAFAQGGRQASFELAFGAGIGGIIGMDRNERADAGTDIAGAVGFGMSFALNDRWLVRGSWRFSEYVESFALPDEVSPPSQEFPLMPDLRPTRQNFEDADRISHRLLYLEYELALRYYLTPDRRLRPFTEGGLSGGNYRGTFFGGDLWNWDLKSEPQYRSFSPIVKAGVGLDWRIVEEVRVFSLVAGHFHGRSITDPARARLQPWKVDLELGVRFCIY